MSEKLTRNNAARSKKGCLTCRSRHIKCDEGKPTCAACRKAHQKCRQPGVIHSLVLCSEYAKVDESGQSRLPSSVEHRSSRYSPGANAKVSAPARLNIETSSEFPSSSSTLFPPTLDQILFNATENRDFNSPKTVGDVERSTPNDTVLIDREAALLLRTYEEGIGVWMDVFDSSLSYQQGLLTLVPSSPLLLNSICALAARQLSLISDARSWTPVAERYYGNSLGLLRALLCDPAMDSEYAIVASILLSSYELLKSPNRDKYHQHFRGAKSLVEALRAYDSTKQLTKASFWIYARHEVGEALNLERCAMLDPRLWPQAEHPTGKAGCPDIYCNDVLRISCEVIHFVFGSNDKRHRRKWVKEWQGLHADLEDWQHGTPVILNGKEYNDGESRRYWFPRSAFASAMCFFHVSKMLLALHCPEPMQLEVEPAIEPNDEIQHHAGQIIDIALSDLPDSVLVTMVQPMFHAAKHIDNPSMRRQVIQRLEQIRVKTGFHTESKVQVLKSPGT